MIGERVAGVGRIAVVRANALGDFLVALPALEALKRAYPGARLTLLGRRWHADFLRGRPGPVDEVAVLPPIPGVTAAPGPLDAAWLRQALAPFAQTGADLGVQLHGGGRYSNPVVQALRPRVSLGLRTPDAAPLDRWVPYIYYQHEVMRYLEVVALVGAAPASFEPCLAITDADRAELRAQLGALPPDIVAIHPGATDPRRRWPPERFAAVADVLAARGASVVITGTAPEHPVVQAVVDTMRFPARPLVDRLTPGGLAALYAACRLVVANDTGPRHLAAAVGTPTVGIYWCGNLVNAGPLTRARHRPMISWTAACPRCGADCVRQDLPEGGDCAHDVSFVTDVTTDDVCRAVLELAEGTAARL